MWSFKYAPKTFEEVVGCTQNVKRVQQMLKQPHKLANMVFHGPPGTGKTTVARLLCSALVPIDERRDRVLSVDASTDRGLHFMQNRVKPFAMQRGRHKLVILDESDALTSEATNALRRIVECTSDHTTFVFICNYSSRLPKAILSRCMVIHFQALPREEIMRRLTTIMTAENIRINASDEKYVCEALTHRGDMRRAIQLLESASARSSNREISLPDVQACSYDIIVPDPVKRAHDWRRLGFTALAVLSMWMKEAIGSGDESLILAIAKADHFIALGSLCPWVHVYLVEQLMTRQNRKAP